MKSHQVLNKRVRHIIRNEIEKTLMVEGVRHKFFNGKRSANKNLASVYSAVVNFAKTYKYDGNSQKVIKKIDDILTGLGYTKTEDNPRYKHSQWKKGPSLIKFQYSVNAPETELAFFASFLSNRNLCGVTIN